MTAKTALIIVDVQPVFMNDPKMLTVDGDDLVRKCKSLLDRARDLGIPIVHIQHVDKDDMPNGTRDQDMAIHPSLTPLADEPVIGKRFGSGFMETTLEATLASTNARHLVVCGLSAYGCVNQTVLFAKLFGYQVTVVQDAIAAPDSEVWSVPDGIPIFLSNWEKGGILLESTHEVLAA